ncbi:ectoine/hydroxyectoine ABC transporter permease subunit EhuD [Tomitella biformata]|uniref:ectoine/hydroxyectoine ABC transporter permease subunit EhuD n=1 Tax=Tomitella biformata TaxID=630403 RepID=UPI0004655C52|nr:ectoine/hydroxyectoine ABC transporter permease subunit EhuD [Tomitella biformata]
MNWSWDTTWDVLPVLLQGFKITLLVTVIGSAIAVALGLVVAVILRSGFRPVTYPLSFLFTFIRSTPLVVQLTVIYVGIPTLKPLYIGIIVIGIHYATYMSESYRAGIDSVPIPQWEACTALSLPAHRKWIDVILPQAIRNVVPALGNNIVAMFKDTPFLSVITVTEMVRAAQVYGSDNFRYMEAFTLAGLIFLAASYPVSVLLRRLEAHLARY